MKSIIGASRRVGVRALRSRDGGTGLARAARFVTESLENRRLFAAVSWTGAVSDVWNLAGNWSNNAIPNSADDVTINTATNVPVRITNGAQAIRSLVSNQPITVGSGTSLAVSTTAAVAANVSIVGGTLTGGAYTFSGGGAIVAGGSSGSVASVTVTGDILLPAANFGLTLSGTTSFTNVRLQAGNTNLNLAPNFSFSGQILSEGAATGTRFINVATGGAGSATVQQGGSIRMLAGSGGGLNIRRSSTGNLINNGSIASEDASQILSITTDTFVNAATGTLSSTTGTVTIGATTYRNQGTFSVGSGSVLNLDGSFDTSGSGGSFGTWSNAGGTVNITGSIANTGGTIPLSNATGSFRLLGGTITGGAVTYADGQVLVPASTGTLASVAVAGDLTLSASNVTITLSGTTTFNTMRLQGNNVNVNLAPSYTLVSDIIAEGATAGSRFVNVAVGGSGTATISNTGSITLAASSAGALTVRRSSTGTLINDGLISAENAALALTVTVDSFTNNATLQAVGGLLTSNSTSWRNTGMISVSNGGDFSIGGTLDATSGIGTISNSGGTVNIVGAITNTGSTITLSPTTGSLALSGGSITGGSVVFGTSEVLIPTSLGGTLTNVAITGEIAVAVTNAAVSLAGSTTFTALRLQASNASVNFAPSYTLNSPIIADGATAGTRFVNIAVGGNGTATIASGGSITLGSGAGGSLTVRRSSTGTLINNGNITANAAAQTLLIQVDAFTNAGTISATTGTLTVNTTAWTNPGTIAVAPSGTVNLDGTLNATGGIGTFNNTGGTVNITGAINNANSTFTLNPSTGSFNLVGGSITGGTVSYSGSQALQTTSSGGTLSSVSVGGEVALAVSNASVTLAGNTTFAALRLQASNASVNFAPGYVLSSPVVSDGATAGARFVNIAVGGNGTATIAAGGSIRSASGVGGTLTIRRSSTGTLINNGLISNDDAAQSLLVQVDVFSNAGTTQAAAGTLTINSTTWTNTGTLGVAANATLILDGTLNATAGIGTFANTGGTIRIAGTITNTGATLTLNNSTGSPVLVGGTIAGGTLAYADGQRLEASTSGGTLNGVIVNGELALDAANEGLTLTGSTTFTALRLQAGNASVNFAPGYTLRSPIIADGVGAGTRFVNVAVGGAGTATIAAEGSIRLAADAGGSLQVRDSSTGTLVNNGLISADAGSQGLAITSRTVNNAGTIQATAGSLSITSQTYTNTGTFAVGPNADFTLGGTFNAVTGVGTLTSTGGSFRLQGTLNNAGATLTLNASTGPLQLVGGTISGGNVVLTAPATLDATSSSGTLADVILTGEVVVDTGESIMVRGTTRFTAIRLQGANATLNVAPGYTLNDAVIADGTNPGTRFVNAAVGGTGTLTISESGSIRLAADASGALSIRDSSPSTVINNGTITNEAPGQSVSITASTFTNNGTIRASTGDINLRNPTNYNSASQTLTGGTYAVAADGEIRFTNVTITTLAAAFSFSGPTSGIYSAASGTTDALDPNLTIANVGSLAVSNNSVQVFTTLGNAGTVSVGPAGAIGVTGDFTTTGTVSFDIAAGTANGFGTLSVIGAANLSGALLANLVGGFEPAAGQVITVIGTVARSGEFTSFTSGTSPTGKQLDVRYSATAVTFVPLSSDPLAPSTPALAPASDTGSSSTDGYTSDNTPTVTGFADPGATVTIFDGTTQVGLATADASGGYTVTTTPLTDGTHSLTAVATPSGGGAPVTSPGALSIRIDTTAPALTLPNPGRTTTTNPEGAIVTFTATATDAGDPAPVIVYSIQPGTLFAVGTTTVTVTATDAAGNVATGTFDVLVSLPTLTPSLSPDSDTGVSSTDGYTSDNTPTVTGSTVAGSAVTIFDGTTAVGSGTADSSGNYSITLSTLADGVHAITAVSTPPSGEPISSPGTLSLTIDSTGPVLTLPTIPPITVTNPNDYIVNYTATALDALDAAPTVSYSIEPNSAFAIGTTTVTVTARDKAGNVSTGTFNVTLGFAAPDQRLGGLDLSFGNGTGQVVVPVPNASLTAIDSFAMPGGQVLTAGYDNATGDLLMTRLNLDGSIDTSFGSAGVMRVAGPQGLTVRRVQFAASGTVYLIGVLADDTPAITRFSANGIQDPAFNQAGGAPGILTVPGFVAGDRIDSIAEGRGKIKGFLVGGSANLAGVQNAVLVNLLANLTINTKFNKGMFVRPGGELGTFSSITITPKSAIFLGGTASSGATADGSLLANAVVVQLSSAGKAAKFGIGGAIVGGVPGYAVTTGERVIVQADGKILISASIAASVGDALAGRFGRAVLRLTNRGVPDTTFNAIGVLITATPPVASNSVRTLGSVKTLATPPVITAFDRATASLVELPGGKVREIAAVRVNGRTDLVQSQVVADAVDLAAGAFTITARRPVNGGARLSGTIAISNTGTLSATATVPVNLFASLDGTLDPSDIALTPGAARLKLKPGGTARAKLSFTAPNPGGTYVVIAVLSPAGVTPDLTTSNDQSVSATSFVVNAPTSPARQLILPSLAPARPFFSSEPVSILQ